MAFNRPKGQRAPENISQPEVPNVESPRKRNWLICFASLEATAACRATRDFSLYNPKQEYILSLSGGCLWQPFKPTQKLGTLLSRLPTSIRPRSVSASADLPSPDSSR